MDGFRNLDRLEFSVCGDDAPVVVGTRVGDDLSGGNPPTDRVE